MLERISPLVFFQTKMDGELNGVSYSDPSTVIFFLRVFSFFFFKQRWVVNSMEWVIVIPQLWKIFKSLKRQICIDIILHYNIKILKELLISFWLRKKLIHYKNLVYLLSPSIQMSILNWAMKIKRIITFQCSCVHLFQILSPFNSLPVFGLDLWDH